MVVVPGAIIMVNDSLAEVSKQRLMTQLFITEAISGDEFDIRLAADPDYAKNLRILRQRLLVSRNFQDTNNRDAMDVVVYVKHAMVYIECNCYGPTGMTHALRNISWGQLCIFDTDINRTCLSCGRCRCSCANDGYIDGYELNDPYYPARFDPEHPQENHWYNRKNTYPVVFGTRCNCTNKTLCDVYFTSGGRIVSGSGCRCVKG